MPCSTGRVRGRSLRSYRQVCRTHASMHLGGSPRNVRHDSIRLLGTRRHAIAPSRFPCRMNPYFLFGVLQPLHRCRTTFPCTSSLLHRMILVRLPMFGLRAVVQKCCEKPRARVVCYDRVFWQWPKCFSSGHAEVRRGHRFMADRHRWWLREHRDRLSSHLQFSVAVACT